jgi:hypothetical protein
MVQLDQKQVIISLSSVSWVPQGIPLLKGSSLVVSLPSEQYLSVHYTASFPTSPLKSKSLCWEPCCKATNIVQQWFLGQDMFFLLLWSLNSFSNLQIGFIIYCANHLNSTHINDKNISNSKNKTLKETLFYCIFKSQSCIPCNNQTSVVGFCYDKNDPIISNMVSCRTIQHFQRPFLNTWCLWAWGMNNHTQVTCHFTWWRCCKGRIPIVPIMRWGKTHSRLGLRVGGCGHITLLTHYENIIPEDSSAKEPCNRKKKSTRWF